MATDNELANASRTGVLRLEVVTPDGPAVRTEANQVEAPSVDGEFGVLPGHLPLLAALRAGVVRYRSAGKSFTLAVGPGFAEVGPLAMSILTDRCVDAKDIDTDKVRGALEGALRQLDAVAGGHESAERLDAQRAVDWLQAQLDAAREAGRS